MIVGRGAGQGRSGRRRVGVRGTQGACMSYDKPDIWTLAALVLSSDSAAVATSEQTARTDSNSDSRAAQDVLKVTLYAHAGLCIVETHLAQEEQAAASMALLSGAS
jgi:hypothetical protein